MTPKSTRDDSRSGSDASARARVRVVRHALRRSFSIMNDSELVDAMRRRDAGSIEAFVDRFHGILLNYGRRAGFAEEECDEFVQELLDDVALDLTLSSARPPENIRRYVIGAFRHRFFKQRRERERRDRYVREAGYQLDHERDPQGRIKAPAACSEFALREARGTSDDDAVLASTIHRLSLLLDEGLSGEERDMLSWVSEGVPQRLIAEWLGIDHAAARQRLARLRRRLSETALEYGSRLPPTEQRQLREFLRRCGALPTEARRRSDHE